MSVKTCWVCLDLSLSIIVFDEGVPLGSVRIKTKCVSQTVLVLLLAVPATGNGIFQLC